MDLLINEVGVVESVSQEEIAAETIGERCKHHLLIKVNNTAVAATILEEHLGTIHYEILNLNEIKLYDYLNVSDEVIEILVLNKVAVYTVQEVKGDLEEYYMKIIMMLKMLNMDIL